jgi:hypothetical protein
VTSALGLEPVAVSLDRPLIPVTPATGQDQHSLLVDYDIFVNVPRLDAALLTTAVA